MGLLLKYDGLASESCNIDESIFSSPDILQERENKLVNIYLVAITSNKVSVSFKSENSMRILLGLLSCYL